MSVRIINADVMDGLAQLEDESVQCVCTSPPYWGLRDYQTATWDGGDASCDHVSGKARNDTARETPGGRGGSFRGGDVMFKDICGKCGAIRVDNQIGLEPTPEAFVAKLVEVFREVRRVLRSDGVCWVNLGDSYASIGRTAQSASPKGTDGQNRPKIEREVVWGEGRHGNFSWTLPGGIKPKDLVGIPWRVAFALQADGWYLRQEIIWAKPNPMPESVTDRCTKAHEHIFLLTKSARYFYDAGAIAEPAQDWSTGGPGLGMKTTEHYGASNGGNSGLIAGHRRYKNGESPSTRNKRSVWTIATQPYAEAHFATFPEELPETCIKAGSKPGDTILDPFAGAGTTGLVADKLGRNAILIELSAEYAAMAERRIKGDCPMFASVEVTL